MIVLDLEWNQPFGGRRMEEIIQIGAVRLAEPGGAVQDWFNMHIRPSIYPKLSPVASSQSFEGRRRKISRLRCSGSISTYSCRLSSIR